MITHKINTMKKIILLFFFLFSIFLSNAQTGAATQSLQTRGNATLTLIKKEADTTNQNLRVLAKTSALTISTLIVTGSGSIGSGAKKLEFLTSSDFSGTINGTAFIPSLYIPFGNLNYQTLPAINYVVTTGSITIIDSR